MSKSTKAEFFLRVDKTKSMLLDGLTRYEILEYNKKEWGMSAQQVAIYIKNAYRQIHNHFQKDSERLLDKTHSRLERLYRAAVKKKDYHLARQLLLDLRGLHGLDKPSKLAMTDPTGEKQAETSTTINFVAGEVAKMKPVARERLYEALEKKNGNGVI